MLTKLPIVSAVMVLACHALLYNYGAPANATATSAQSCVCDLEISMMHTTPPPANCYNSTTLYAEGYWDGNCDSMGCGTATPCAYNASISMSGNNCAVLAIFETCEGTPNSLGVCYSCSSLGWASPFDPIEIDCGETRCYDAFACDVITPCSFQTGNLVASIVVECTDCP